MRNAAMLIAGCLVLTILTCCDAKKQPVHDSFEHTLSKHLEAVQHRDLAGLEPTVADSVTLITPNGNRTTSKDFFMKLHVAWFAEKDWEWIPTELKTESTDSLGYALVRYAYTSKDSIGNITSATNNYLVLIFKKLDSGWQLIHDQNTRIPDQR